MMFRRMALAAMLALGLGGCGPTSPPPFAPPPFAPPLAVSPSKLALTATSVPPAGAWRVVQPGLEYRELEVNIHQHPDRLRLARVDPRQWRFRVAYDPAQPRPVGGWLEAERAQLAVNGGYFDPDNRALGLLIRDGQVYGQPYQGFGGMLAAGPEGVRVRWNVAEPYVPGEALTEAVQNFPMLVLPGGTANLGIDDNGQFALRTAVGQDRQGRMVFVVSPGGVFTLTDFSAWLAASDLDLEVALNLDGGSSSGLLVRDSAGQTLGVDSWSAVPEVIVAEPLNP